MKSWLFRVIKKARTLATGTVIPAFLTFVSAHETLVTKFGAGPDVPRTPALEWMLWWRNTSLLLALSTGLIAIPRWQSLIGLGLTLFFLYLIVSTY